MTRKEELLLYPKGLEASAQIHRRYMGVKDMDIGAINAASEEDYEEFLWCTKSSNRIQERFSNCGNLSETLAALDKYLGKTT